MVRGLCSSRRKWTTCICQLCATSFTVCNCSDKHKVPVVCQICSTCRERGWQWKSAITFDKSRCLCNLCFLTTETSVKMEGKHGIDVLKIPLLVQLLGKVFFLKLSIYTCSYFEKFYDAAFHVWEFFQIWNGAKNFSLAPATSSNSFSICRPEFPESISQDGQKLHCWVFLGFIREACTQ